MEAQFDLEFLIHLILFSYAYVITDIYYDVGFVERFKVFPEKYNNHYIWFKVRSYDTPSFEYLNSLIEILNKNNLNSIIGYLVNKRGFFTISIQKKNSINSSLFNEEYSLLDINYLKEILSLYKDEEFIQNINDVVTKLNYNILDFYIEIYFKSYDKLF